MTGDPFAQARWEVWQTDPGQWRGPADIVGAGVAAMVPGTSASAIREAHGVDAALAIDHDARDWWWRTTVEISPHADPEARPDLLRFEGVSTHWTAWWDGVEVASGGSMFRPRTVPVDPTPGPHELVLHCRALSDVPTPTRPRAPWRSLLVRHPSYRWHRTSGVGRIPWHGTAAAVGPWRPIRLITREQAAAWVVRTTLRPDGDGEIRVHRPADGRSLGPRLDDALLDGPRFDEASLDDVRLVLDGVPLPMTRHGGQLLARVTAPAPWWPHTHGEPALHTLEIHRGGQLVATRSIGFRTVRADRSDDGFALVVNGTPVRARGVCWVPPDPLALGCSAEERRAALRTLVESGANLVRVTGTMAWEPPEFFEDCAALGLMVWQDCMLHTLAPPEDKAWLDDLGREVRVHVGAAADFPSLVVVSGGSETEQQPTLWGLPPESGRVRALTETIPAAIADVGSDAIVVTSTPTGGVLPTSARRGISHWFGVGAYLRPLDDARRAGVRFVAECLAFAHPPERSVVRAAFGEGSGFDLARWQTAVVRDPGASWDFQDSLAHYATALFGIDPVDLLATDPERALDLLRATGAHVTETTLAEWRRPASTCAGAIVLSGRDLAPGAGWGLTDCAGGRKAALHGAARAWRPVAVLLTDEGLDGLDIHLLNDTAQAHRGLLELKGRRADGTVLVEASREVSVPAWSAATHRADDLVGSFRDLNHAWAFGPRDIDTVTVTWRVGESPPEVVAAVHLVDGPARAHEDVGLQVDVLGGVDVVGGVDVGAAGAPWVLGGPGVPGVPASGGDEAVGVGLVISAQRTATFVAIEAPGWVASDNWFHLAGGGQATVRLHPDPLWRTGRPSHAPSPTASVRCLNGVGEVTVGLGLRVSESAAERSTTRP